MLRLPSGSMFVRLPMNAMAENVVTRPIAAGTRCMIEYSQPVW